MEFGWKIVVGSLIGFLGAAFGSVGGVGGGGIYVPMLTLIIGFDPKSSTAISKCKNYSFLCRAPMLYPRIRSSWRFVRRYDHGSGGINGLLQSKTEAPDSGNAHHRLRSGFALPADAHARDQRRRRVQRNLRGLDGHRPPDHPLPR